jgi:hypothetical protein
MSKTLCLSVMVLLASGGVGRSEEAAPGAADSTAAPPAAEVSPSPPTPSSKSDLLNPFAEAEAPAAAVEADVAKPAPGPATADATLSFRDEASDKFILTEARFVMDGVEMPTVITNPTRGQTYVIYHGPLAAGRHLVTAHLTYQGKKRGAFSYMEGYKLNVSSDGVFTTPEDRKLGFTIVSREQKGINVPLERRVAISVLYGEAPSAPGQAPQRVSR